MVIKELAKRETAAGCTEKDYWTREDYGCCFLSIHLETNLLNDLSIKIRSVLMKFAADTKLGDTVYAEDNWDII